MQRRLPFLDDDPDVGVQKEQSVTRDGSGSSIYRNAARVGGAAVGTHGPVASGRSTESMKRTAASTCSQR
jgi:hypothetical protein